MQLIREGGFRWSTITSYQAGPGIDFSFGVSLISLNTSNLVLQNRQ